VDEHLQERFQTALPHVIRASVPAVLAEFEAALLATHSPLLQDDLSRTQVLAHAREIVEKAAQEISDPEQQAVHYSLARDIGATRAAAGVHPSESLRASDILFGVVIRRLHAELSGSGGEHAAQEVTLAAVTLHEVLARALRAAADSYVGVLLNRVHQAQIEERQRVSRELHDRIGHGIGVAQRDLELYEIYRLKDPDRAFEYVQTALRVLTDTLDVVRQVISDLRLVEPMESLEKAIKLFLDSSAGPDLARHVEVNGDEAWAPIETIAEAFVIIRESLRNTIAHAKAGQVRVRVDIAPDELRALVVDDGQGFDPSSGRPGGTGLLSMRERAALLGGGLTLNSKPGRGTHVELWVPLTGGSQ
jgi:signal transduction histidine kinase